VSDVGNSAAAPLVSSQGIGGFSFARSLSDVAEIDLLNKAGEERLESNSRSSGVSRLAERNG